MTGGAELAGVTLDLNLVQATANRVQINLHG
jgi:hypothetical protein